MSRPSRERGRVRTVESVWTLIIILLAIWLLLTVLGFAIKGLIWLAVLGIVLFAVTAIIGFIRRGRAGTRA